MSRPEDIEQLITAMCMTWDHSFGLMSKHQQESLRRSMAQVFQHDVSPFIARAIMAAKAEEREACAVIAGGYRANMSIWMSAEWPTAKQATNYASADIAATIRRRGEG